MDLVTVRAVTDECINEVWTLDRLEAVSRINQESGKPTRRSWTAPQKHVAVALPSGCTPFAPSEGSGILELLIVGGRDTVLLREIRVLVLVPPDDYELSKSMKP